MVCRTLDKRGKSLTPESRMSIELSRRCRDVRRDATDDERESAIVTLYSQFCRTIVEA